MTYPQFSRPAPVNSGNAKADQKYEQQQTNLIAQANPGSGKQLQQKAENRNIIPNASPAQTQQLEPAAFSTDSTDCRRNTSAASSSRMQSRQPQPGPSPGAGRK